MILVRCTRPPPAFASGFERITNLVLAPPMATSPPAPLDTTHGILGNYAAGGSYGPYIEMFNDPYPRGFSLEPTKQV